MHCASTLTAHSLSMVVLCCPRVASRCRLLLPIPLPAVLVKLPHLCCNTHQERSPYVQLCYILGAGGHSWVIGYGKRPPRRPHHRDSALRMDQSGDWQAFNRDGDNPNPLIGGLCGGPLEDGTWKDDRADYKGNEVALDYNAALILAAAMCLSAPPDLVQTPAAEVVPHA